LCGGGAWIGWGAGSALMSTILIVCPKNRVPVSTGMKLGKPQAALVMAGQLEFPGGTLKGCSACGKDHRWSGSDISGTTDD
jgi:hypothetical protein